MVRVVTKTDHYSGEINDLIKLFESGVGYIHIRKPNSSLDQLLGMISKIPQLYISRVVVHLTLDMVIPFGASSISKQINRIHISGWESGNFDHLLDVVKSVGRSYTISAPVHSLESFYRIRDLVDEVTLSPIYDSISKVGYSSGWSEDQIEQVLADRGSVRMIALGGISESNIDEVFDAGFDDALLMGAVWNSFDTASKLISGREYQREYVLSIAGYDPTAGAGVLADIKTFEQLSTYGLAVVTVNTIQDDLKLYSTEPNSISTISRNLEVLFAKYRISYVKIGVVNSGSDLLKIVKLLRRFNRDVKIVWDPVIRSSSGFMLMNDLDSDTLDRVLSSIYMVTPNLDEYNQLYQDRVAVGEHILLKGGHNVERRGVDQLLIADGDTVEIIGEDFGGISKHGTGCVLSSAITSYLALGYKLTKSVELGKVYVEKMIRSNNTNLAYHNI